MGTTQTQTILVERTHMELHAALSVCAKRRASGIQDVEATPVEHQRGGEEEGAKIEEINKNILSQNSGSSSGQLVLGFQLSALSHGAAR
mmetsp:Transcript_34478/g.103117  ORF Transcript_34478/g.103117 Transcript_34478/m.103117 type:complete len:89 (+) Transcript_34478:4747-5013(+)